MRVWGVAVPPRAPPTALSRTLSAFCFPSIRDLIHPLVGAGRALRLRGPSLISGRHAPLEVKNRETSKDPNKE